MSTTAGVFTETRLQNIRLRVEQLLLDKRIKLQYQPRTDALKAVLDNNTARITALQDPKKDNIVEVEWMNACQDFSTEFSNCGFDGEKLSTNTKEYELNYEITKGFSVNEEDFIDNDFNFDEAVAKGMLAVETQIENDFGPAMIAFLNANAGVSVGPANGKGTINGTEIDIPAAYWDAKLIAYLNRVVNLNQFTSPFILDAANLVEQITIANAEAGNADGKGAIKLLSTLPYYSDEFTLDQVNVDSLTYLIQTGTIAFANKAYYPNIDHGGKPTQYPDQVRYSVDSKLFSGLVFDVYTKQVCNEGSRFYTTKFQVTFKFGIFINPTGCSETNTGILVLKCA